MCHSFFFSAFLEIQTKVTDYGGHADCDVDSEGAAMNVEEKSDHESAVKSCFSAHACMS